MPDPAIVSRPELVYAIEEAWADLGAFLAGLSDPQMIDVFDEQGWNVRDHITHLAAWEESVAMLFQGKPRYQTLGVDESMLSSGQFDEINVIIRNRYKHLSIREAMDEFRKIHNMLIASVELLSDADLNLPVGRYFPQALANDHRRVLEIILDNTTHHFREHLNWIKTLVTNHESGE